MTAQETGIGDIFEGAEKIEIFGKLPSLLWAYISRAHAVIEQCKAGGDVSARSAQELRRLLGVLDSAAHHLDNKDLKQLISKQAQVLAGFGSGNLSGPQFAESLGAGLPLLKQVAGPRLETNLDDTFATGWVEQEVERVERIKAGRSADVVVSMDLLEDVRDYLAKEVLTEGISSILVIDNAGSLIVNIGSRINLDAVSLAAVAAANFAATEHIARLIGERDFVLLFYKGHNESFHFSRVGMDYIIVTIFDNSLSLGLLRLKIAEVSQVLERKLPKRQA